MNFNLKNRPSEPDFINLGEVEALRSYNYRAEKWFEAFEKELRQKLTDLGDTTIHSMHDNVKGKIAAQNQKGIIEEVLGVEPKIKEETEK